MLVFATGVSADENGAPEKEEPENITELPSDSQKER
jgi:hypothetical protein